MLSFKDITDYYDFSDEEISVLRFIIDKACENPTVCSQAVDNQEEKDIISTSAVPLPLQPPSDSALH